MSILQQGTWTAWHITQIGRDKDIVDEDWEKRLILSWAKRIFDLDLSKCVFSGRVSDSTKIRSSQITIADSFGNIVQTVLVKGLPAAIDLRIAPTDGCALDDVVRRNFLTLVRDQWLAANGFDSDYPCDVECTVDRDSLFVKVVLC